MPVYDRNICLLPICMPLVNGYKLHNTQIEIYYAPNVSKFKRVIQLENNTLGMVLVGASLV
jgi:hypothetical protein